MNDELDQLTDEKLTEVFAAEVASEYRSGWAPSYSDPDNAGLAEPLEPPTPYSTSADAVMSFLEREHTEVITSYLPRMGWPWGILLRGQWHYSTTFARAACISLIRAKRALRAS